MDIDFEDFLAQFRVIVAKSLSTFCVTGGIAYLARNPRANKYYFRPLKEKSST